MRIDIDTAHVVKLTLSRRNVEDLLHALDNGLTRTTLTRSFGPDTKGVILAVEENDVHYAEVVETAQVYCQLHDLFDCWLCPHLAK